MIVEPGGILIILKLTNPLQPALTEVSPTTVCVFVKTLPTEITKPSTPGVLFKVTVVAAMDKHAKAIISKTVKMKTAVLIIHLHL